MLDCELYTPFEKGKVFFFFFNSFSGKEKNCEWYRTGDVVVWVRF
jgi:hypothetical protein